MRPALLRSVLSVALAVVGCGGPVEGAEDEAGTVELVDETVAEADAVEAQKADVAGLTSSQAKTVLGELDGICGDTWCAGDYTWYFKKISCNFGQKRCTLTMFITDAYGEGKSWWRSARITGLTSYRSLIDGSELRDGFYDKVTTAIGKIEEKLRAE